MEFGKDDHSALIASNAGDEEWNTWTFEQGASIDSTGLTGGNGWDAINFDAGYTTSGFDSKGVINIGKENDRKKNFIVYAPPQRSVIEMNGGYGNNSVAQAVLTINGRDEEGEDGADLQFYGGSSKNIFRSVISMDEESFLTINAGTLYMQGKLGDMQGEPGDNDNGSGGITVCNDSHLDINLAGDFTTKTSSGITVLEEPGSAGIGQHSEKKSSLNIDADSIHIEALSNIKNDLNSDDNDKKAVSGSDVQGVGIYGNTLKADARVDVELNAQKNIRIEANAAGIYAAGNSHVTLTADGSGADADTNQITVAANGSDSNTIGVYAGGTKWGSSEVELTGSRINIFSNNKAVWASGDGGTVNINGVVSINARYTGQDEAGTLAEDEGQHIAIVAGVAGEESIETNHGEVHVNLQGDGDSRITGDIVAARDGIVNITRADGYTGSLQIFGDILAGNGRTDGSLTLGAANVDLGKGGYWEGRADDYQDADLKKENSYYDPHFTDGTVSSAGEVNITMGEGSVWNVTGQSWVTNLTGDKSTVILCGKETDGYAVHIGKLEGENTFVVNLDPENVAGSDMIYIGEGTSDRQTLAVRNESALLNLGEGERIRFATIANAEGSFAYGGEYTDGSSFGETYAVKGRGLKNVELGVQYVDMDKEEEAEKTYHDVGTEADYNGGTGFNDSESKPGSEYVDKTYNQTAGGENSQNVYLVRGEGSSSGPDSDEDLTDSGRTIVNMSHANYKNAIYMDRLNKRLGEARYIDGDEGMWVRLRHDRIGMQDEFRSMNTMYQLGYDKLDDRNDKGERHIGAAIDYMDGSTSYSDIFGEGETKRWGFWLYETWLGNKGHYADYIVKYGHLDNDFDLTDRDSGEKVTGDYSNNVFSASAEYGRKKDIGNSWYVEPQVQMQYAYVTSADYTTSQGTRVELDGIDSLIGRAGFRLGRDVGEKSTVYLKADILHEFLGDQRITAGDATGSLDKTYENEGTWYDVGFGFAKAVGHNSYVYLDFETSFGNDNDETYQINAGMQWSF